MPYPWECIDCDEYYEDLVKNGTFYCNKMRRYVSPKESSCNTYFKKRDRNRPLRLNKSSNCYITTAVVTILGYEDNCEKLETLRNFRDNYMKKHEEYLPLLEDYNIVGPLISERLEQDEKRLKIALTVNNFIDAAIDAINDKEYIAAIHNYENMTYYLMDLYEIDFDLLSNNQKGRQRKREINQ